MVEEIDTSWISSMLTANSKFHIGVNGAHFITGNLDEKSDAILIERFKGAKRK
jgi:hypothetical protein